MFLLSAPDNLLLAFTILYTAKISQNFCQQLRITHITSQAFHKTLKISLLWKELMNNLNVI